MTFTPENAAKARELIGLYPEARSALLPLLHLAQEQDGWVSPEAMQEIAAMLEMAPAQVLGTCTFYTMYKRDHARELVVSVCTNVSCLVNGGPELYEDLAARFSDDETVLVEEVECIAACDTAPVMQVNYEFHGNQTVDGAAALVAEYKSGARIARGLSGGRIA